jgi:AraC family transcriptional regulator
MQSPERSSDSVWKISSASEVLHGIDPLVSNVDAKRRDITVERYAVPGEIKTPRLGFENQTLVGIIWTGNVKEVGGQRRSISSRNAVSISPVGVALQEQVSSGMEFTNLWLMPTLLSRVAREMELQDRFEVVPQWGIRDEQIEIIATAAECEIRSDLGVGNLFMESLATALAAHVLARYSSRRPAIRESRARMSPMQLRRSTDFIEANLGEELHLSELAANVGLSAYYFCRMFKQSTNLSPHQFVLRKRIEQSQHLLKKHNLPIIEIAAQLGFSDQSHFSRVFRSVVGTTPRRYSRQH